MGVYKCIMDSFENLGCRVQGINGTENHVHVIYHANLNISLDELLKKVKLSSQFEIRKKHNQCFSWEEGLFVYTTCKKDLFTEKLMLKQEGFKHEMISLEEELYYLRKNYEKAQQLDQY